MPAASRRFDSFVSAFTRISPTFSLVPFLAAVALRTVYSNCVLPSHTHTNIYIIVKVNVINHTILNAIIHGPSKAILKAVYSSIHTKHTTIKNSIKSIVSVIKSKHTAKEKRKIQINLMIYVYRVEI